MCVTESFKVDGARLLVMSVKVGEVVGAGGISRFQSRATRFRYKAVSNE